MPGNMESVSRHGEMCRTPGCPFYAMSLGYCFGCLAVMRGAVQKTKRKREWSGFLIYPDRPERWTVS